jgi:hypothetical protein
MSLVYKIRQKKLETSNGFKKIFFLCGQIFHGIFWGFCIKIYTRATNENFPFFLP